MTDLTEFAKSRLAQAESAHQRRTLVESAREGVEVMQGDEWYTSFACNDYLGLSQHPGVISAAASALDTYGAGAGASRLVTGNHPFFAPLERELASYCKKEAALVFGSGYLTNMGVITALAGEGDLILADKLVHACIVDGAQLSGATFKRFRHNDLVHAESLLGEHRAAHKNCLIITDHIFSMDGDRAPLAELAALAKKYDAWLMIDDAHGIGFHDHEAPVDIWMGTLSKALGSYGGYVAASRAVIDYLTTSARSFIFTTALPPASCAAALKALEILKAEPERATRAQALAVKVATALGLPLPQSAILPVIYGSEQAALAASAALKELGILAAAIRPPTVPPGSARLRLAFSSNHTNEQIAQLIAALKPLKVAA
jgi:8-amino-7-oxononanoate synthase